MKVFTVGLDQKPPLKDESEKSEKSGSPPPGYTAAAGGTAVPLPMGPELALPPTPLIMRKSRGYKGILLVMLSVFLIALFALTLSEIAYNRQRDENFFRLRWAELKHRLGGYADYDYYFNRGPYAYSALNKQKELGDFTQQQQPIVPIQQQQQQQQRQETTTPTPVLAEVIDTSKSGRRPLGADLTGSAGSSSSAPAGGSSSSSSQQTSAEQPFGSMPPEMSAADARLQFLRSILRRIKQHAEDMGFDGMMQVSVIEVEPQQAGEELNARKPSPPSSAIQQILPGLFSHLIGGGGAGQPLQQQQPHIDEPRMLNVKSDSFLDGFGEIHQPSFLQNNQIAEQNRARLESNDNNNNNNNNEEPPVEFEGPIQWSRVNNPFRPEGFFRPPSWHLIQQQQQQQQPQQQQAQPQQQPHPGFLMPPGAGFPPPHVLPRPFEQWGPTGGEDEFLARRFGAGQAPPEAQPQGPAMIQVFPQSAPLFFPPPQVQPQPQGQPPQFAHQFPAGQMLGVGAPQPQEFRGFKPAVAPPPPPPAVFEPAEFQSPQAQSQPQAQPQELGEMHGGRIGQFVKELIANRLHTLSQLQAQFQPQLPHPGQMTFVPPENRIQIEPPFQQQQQQQAKDNNNNEEEAEKAPKATIVDSDDNNNNNNNNLNAGWTHQPQLGVPAAAVPVPGPVGGDATSEDSLESVRNFAKMMAAGVEEEESRRRADAIAASLGPRRPAAAGGSSSSSATVDNEDSASGAVKPRPVPIMPILSIDPPVVDFPAVRFPTPNAAAIGAKDRDSSGTGAGALQRPAGGDLVAVDRVTADAHGDDASAAAGSDAPARALNDGAPSASSANGVFFQVDDPSAAASGPAPSVEARPIITV